MSAFRFNLPDGSREIGELLSHYSVEERDEDLLQIVLPNDTVIDVGWHPAYDPNGAFVITAFQGHWENRISQRCVSTPFDVFEVVQGLIARLSQPFAVAGGTTIRQIRILGQTQAGCQPAMYCTMDLA